MDGKQWRVLERLDAAELIFLEILFGGGNFGSKYRSVKQKKTIEWQGTKHIRLIPNLELFYTII